MGNVRHERHNSQGECLQKAHNWLETAMKSIHEHAERLKTEQKETQKKM